MIEIEVKVRIGTPADVESRLRALGAYPESPRTLEDDTLFDFPDRRFTKVGSLIRLRDREDSAFLTYKEEVKTSMRAKVRKELETGLSELDDARGILDALGLVPIWRYQKYRASFRLGGLHALVDELPIGNFLELEGPKEEIDRWAGALGLSEDKFLLESYRELYDAWREEKGLPEGDMVFTEVDA
jgi:adenylate cyclase class 2